MELYNERLTFHSKYTRKRLGSARPKHSEENNIDKENNSPNTKWIAKNIVYGIQTKISIFISHIDTYYFYIYYIFALIHLSPYPYAYNQVLCINFTFSSLKICHLCGLVNSCGLVMPAIDSNLILKLSNLPRVTLKIQVIY